MERAVEMNPTDAVALAMRGEAAMKLAAARYEILSAEEIAHLESDLDTGVENAPSSDYVFWARGMFRIMCFADVPGASSDLDRSRQINPAYRETHELEGHIHMMREDFAAAARSFGLLVRGNSQDPLVPSRLFMQALALYCAQDFEAAARQALAGADMRPKERMMHVVSAMACRASGQDALATRLAAKAAALPVQRTTMCSRPLLPPSQAPLQEALDAAWRGA